MTNQQISSATYSTPGNPQDNLDNLLQIASELPDTTVGHIGQLGPEEQTNWINALIVQCQLGQGGFRPVKSGNTSLNTDFINLLASYYNWQQGAITFKAAKARLIDYRSQIIDTLNQSINNTGLVTEQSPLETSGDRAQLKCKANAVSQTLTHGVQSALRKARRNYKLAFLGGAGLFAPLALVVGAVAACFVLNPPVAVIAGVGAAALLAGGMGCAGIYCIFKGVQQYRLANPNKPSSTWHEAAILSDQLPVIANVIDRINDQINAEATKVEQSQISQQPNEHRVDRQPYWEGGILRYPVSVESLKNPSPKDHETRDKDLTSIKPEVVLNIPTPPLDQTPVYYNPNVTYNNNRYMGHWGSNDHSPASVTSWKVKHQ